MSPIKLALVFAIPLALALGAAPQEAAAQSCSKPKKGCVVKKDFKKEAVDSSRVKNGSLTSKDVKDGTLTGGDFAAGTLSGDDFAAGGLTGTDIEDGSISAAALAPGVDSDTAADLGCGDDQIAQFVEGAWRCVTGGASYVFLTSQIQNGAFGVSAWDNQCDTDADLAGLPAGTYRAWLSTSISNARDLLPPGPFFRPDGALVALSRADLLNGNIRVNLSMFADGGDPGPGPNPNVIVFTGTLSDGTRSVNAMCSDWTSTNGQFRTGNRTSTDVGWTTGGFGSCGSQRLVYCFQVN